VADPVGVSRKLAAAILLVPIAGCGGGLDATAKPFVPPLEGQRAVLWAVGDGADGGAGGRAVAELIASRRVDRFLYLGDVYDTGTAEDFALNYRPLFGRFDRLAAPTIGNHEYANRELGYEPYWIAARGRPAPSWYSSRAAGWQLLSLNSNEPVGRGSAQLRWLRRQLGRTSEFGSCRIAFIHEPRFSAGLHGDQPRLAAIWRALSGRARMLLSGHDHDMQRFRARDGIVQLVSGAGGHELRETHQADPHLAFARDWRLGALRLKLKGGLARVSFLAVDGTVLDRKRIRCRRPSAART
jgi:Calcineurin-like phosphoesterase